MDKISTRPKQTAEQMQKEQPTMPRESTLNFIRQFARIYMPVSNMPGLVLN